jgi:hypothetical protein
MKRQFQKLTKFPFFLSFLCSLALFLLFLSYLSKQQNIRTLPQNRPATRTRIGFALFCAPRIIRTLRIKGFYYNITPHSSNLTTGFPCGKVEAQHVKTCCRVNGDLTQPVKLFKNLSDKIFPLWEFQIKPPLA